MLPCPPVAMVSSRHPPGRPGAYRMTRLAVGMILAALTASTAAAFPPAEQLPSRPELPDPLVMLDGRRVATRGQWEMDRRPTDAGRGTEVDVWALEQSIDRGYAVATFYCGDVDPDRPDVRQGIQPHIAKLGITRPGPDDWGTIAAWAWGIHRAVDYLVTDPDLDKHRVAVVGHSRLGKTALLAAAFDDRIALAIPLQAGCGGTAPNRCHN